MGRTCSVCRTQICRTCGRPGGTSPKVLGEGLTQVRDSLSRAVARATIGGRGFRDAEGSCSAYRFATVRELLHLFYSSSS